ncbi:MAG: cytochrome c [Elusimicrobia bacterium]|nr:cytochrome c [Elusimicrobiota bacterium]
MRGRRSGLAVLFLAGLSTAACGRGKESSSPEKPAASVKTVPPYYYDLGSSTVDVSGYPERQKENYRFFLAVCGSCHTTARPLNAPYADRDDWRRYVRRMHFKMKGRGIQLDKADEDRLVDFLSYDSRARKMDKREAFEEQQKSLKELFETKSKNVDANRQGPR